MWFLRRAISSKVTQSRSCTQSSFCFFLPFFLHGMKIIRTFAQNNVPSYDNKRRVTPRQQKTCNSTKANNVSAGLYKPSAIVGYRNRSVYIRGSRHTPMNYDAVRDAMPEFFRLLREEEHPAVRAILGHFMFSFIHPYNDGNGRMSRFIMNTMLSTGGYSWTIIPLDRRDAYMQALEKASIEGDIADFTKLIANLLR